MMILTLGHYLLKTHGNGQLSLRAFFWVQTPSYLVFERGAPNILQGPPLTSLFKELLAEEDLTGRKACLNYLGGFLKSMHVLKFPI